MTDVVSGAVVLWVRSVLRRRRASTAALAVIAGLSAGAIGVAFEIAGRGNGAVERYVQRTHAQDVVVQGCPPEVADPFSLSFADLITQCVNAPTMQRFEHEVVDTLPEVVDSMLVGVAVTAIVDPASPNGWGHGILTQIYGEIDPAIRQHELFVAGRPPDPAAPDEVIVGEQASKVGNIHVGDVLELASWRQDELDVATASGLPPQTASFKSTVVGIVRTPKDVQTHREWTTDEFFLPDGLFAGPGWLAAHGSTLAGYGFAVSVELRAGVTPGDFEQALYAGSKGWAAAPPDPSTEIDVPSLERVVAAERQAVLIIAVIGLVAAAAIIALILGRQLRRELDDHLVLAALGMRRRGISVGSALRTLTAALPAAVIAIALVVVLSPLAPIGLARQLEFDHPVRVDWAVLFVIAIGIPLWFVLVATTVVLVEVRRTRTGSHRHSGSFAVPLSPVPRAAVMITRGGSLRLAVFAGSVAIAGAVAAGGLIRSFDAVTGDPARYGAWWDVAVGEYAEDDAVQAGIATVTAHPWVAEAAGFLEDARAAIVDGHDASYISLEPYAGDPQMTMVEGIAPRADDEIALGAATAHRLHKTVGDTVQLTSHFDFAYAATMHISGIAVLNNPVSSASNAGEGIVIRPAVADQVEGREQVASAIVIRIDPNADRDTAIATLFHEFAGSARRPGPQADVANLERLRRAPWLITGLVAVLALASLVHALVLVIQRHRRDLAVLGAIGLTLGQRRRVGTLASCGVGLACAVVGVPVGVVIGRWIWRVVARRVSVPVAPVIAWNGAILAAAVAVLVATVVGLTAGRRSARRFVAAQLHAE